MKDKQKNIIIGIGIIAAGLYLQGDSDYVGGTGSILGSESGGGLSEALLPEEKIIDDEPTTPDKIKELFNIFPEQTTPKKSYVSSDYDKENKGFIESVVSPSLTDIPGIPFPKSQISAKKGTGQAKVVTPTSLTNYSQYISPENTETRLSNIAAGMKAGAGPADYNISVGTYSSSGKSSPKKELKTTTTVTKTREPGTDVFGRKPGSKKRR